MPEFATETKSASRVLQPKEQMDIAFSVPNAGIITMIAAAPPRGLLDPTRRRMDLFRPGTLVPVATRTDEGQHIGTQLSHKVLPKEAGLPGQWIARVTDLEDTAAPFKLQVSFPGAEVLETLTVPDSLVEAFVNATVGQIKIKITRGTNASRIDFPLSLPVQDLLFTVEDFVTTIPIPILPDLNIIEFPNDINSSSIQFSLENANNTHPNGFLRFVLKFEETGKEILGTFDAQLSAMQLTLDLGLEARDGQISYRTSGVRAQFDFEMNVLSIIPDFVLNSLFNFRDRLQEAVEKKAKEAFQAEATRKALSDAVMTFVQPLMGGNAQVVSVKVENNTLTVKFFNA